MLLICCSASADHHAFVDVALKHHGMGGDTVTQLTSIHITPSHKETHIGRGKPRTQRLFKMRLLRERLKINRMYPRGYGELNLLWKAQEIDLELNVLLSTTSSQHMNLVIDL